MTHVRTAPFLKLFFILLSFAACADSDTASSPPANIRGDDAPQAPMSEPSTSGAAPAEESAETSPSKIEIRSSLGVVVLQLDPENAPGTVRNFLNLVNDGYYDNTMIHFVAKDKMIVGGRYAADGAKLPTSPPIRNEAHNGVPNLRGTIAMVRDADRIDSATTEFFINLADDPQLDHRGEAPEEYGYCVFGHIVEGLDVADKIAAAPTETKTLGGEEIESPSAPIVIEAIRVVR